MARLLADLRDDERVETVHVPYQFAATMADQGRVSLRKVRAVIAVWGRLGRLRARGSIDAFVHPIGSPARASTIKDVLVLLVARVVCRAVVLQFHGAGHATEWPDPLGPFDGVRRVARRVLGWSDVAIVHDPMHVADARRLGIERVEVVPHRVEDAYHPVHVDREDLDSTIRILYVGHMGPHRGVPQLIGAVDALRPRVPGLRLVLAGDTSAAYPRHRLAADIAATSAPSMTTWLGRVHGRDKAEAFGRAHVLVFPSRFEAESFGLVLVEGLMWGLPVVASDWRANPSVLAGAPDVLFHSVAPDLQGSLISALGTAVHRLRSRQWPTFSTGNRQVYEQRYRHGDAAPLVELLVDVATRRPTSAGRGR